MGTTAWKGDILHGGYHLYIGGKEVELDCEVTLEDLPSVAGGHADEKPAPAVENSAGVSIGSPATGVKSFVAPTSFYGPQVPSKPKPKGPL
jgi:DNA repair and recombination protein RAD54B